jgi:hypothetical protein
MTARTGRADYNIWGMYIFVVYNYIVYLNQSLVIVDQNPTALVTYFFFFLSTIHVIEFTNKQFKKILLFTLLMFKFSRFKYFVE